MKPILIAAAAFALTAAPVLAAPAGSGGGSTPNPGIPQERRLDADIGGDLSIPARETPSGVQIDGSVTNGSGSPLGGVYVKLFADGLITEAVQTAADGTFRIEGNPPVGDEHTTVLWFESPAPGEILDSQVVLSAGSRASETIPECVQRVRFIGNVATVSVTLMTPAERMRDVKNSGCLD